MKRITVLVLVGLSGPASAQQPGSNPAPLWEEEDEEDVPPPHITAPAPRDVAPPPNAVPPPPTGSQPPPPAGSQPSPPAARASSFSGMVALAASIRTLYGVTLYGGQVEAGFGEQRNERIALHGNVSAFFGRTGAGLVSVNLRPGFVVERIFGRIRAGGGVQLGILALRGVTRNRSLLYNATLGARLHVSLDVARLGRRSALYLALAAAPDFLLTSNNKKLFPVMLEGQLQLGIRF